MQSSSLSRIFFSVGVKWSSGLGEESTTPRIWSFRRDQGQENWKDKAPLNFIYKKKNSKHVISCLTFFQNQCHTHCRASERGTLGWNDAIQKAPSNNLWVQPFHHSYPLLLHFLKSSHQSCNQLTPQVSF